MRVADALNIEEPLANRLRSLDTPSLRKAWRAMIVDESTREISVAELAKALQVVHERLVLGRTMPPQTRNDIDPRLRRAFDAAVGQFDGVSAGAMKPLRGRPRQADADARMVAAMLVMDTMRQCDVDQQLGWRPKTTQRLQNRAVAKCVGDKQFAAAYRAARRQYEEGRR